MAETMIMAIFSWNYNAYFQHFSRHFNSLRKHQPIQFFEKKICTKLANRLATFGAS